MYDSGKWGWKHPGGNVIHTFAGEDATDAFEAFHPDLPYARKFLAASLIGTCTDAPAPSPLLNSYRKLRVKYVNEGYFNSRPYFYIWNFTHILALEALAVAVAWYFGAASWIGFLLAGVLVTTAQAQAGWLQHDLGHLSLFRNREGGSKWDHLFHRIVIGTMKGASSTWWNWRHYRHHAKPNVILKDMDIAAPYLFALGREPSRDWGKKKRGFMPYRVQHRYWFMVGPPLLLPIYFHLENIYYCFKKNEFIDLAWTMSYYVRFFALFVPFLGVAGAWKLYFLVRFLESHWFVWVTQMNHVPMNIEKDQQREWPLLQALSTCNVEGGHFNDWFTGHLNYQIEHHLFPTMPRHNYQYISKEIATMYEEHGVDFQTKGLWHAFSDIVGCLQDYGRIWYEAFYEL